MRRVASRTGISLSNLQHYFSSKRDLLEALLSRIEDTLRSGFAARLDEAMTAEGRLRAGVRLLLEHTQTRQGSLPLWDLWALAGHDEHARGVMDAGYTRLRRELELLVAEVNPSLTSDRQAEVAASIVALIEGASLLIGYSKPTHQELRGLRDYLEDLAIVLARDEAND